MTDFNEEGFLCTEMERVSKLCYEENIELFSLCEEMNRYCIQLIPKLKFQNTNRQAALADALFLRQIALFESIVILSRKAMREAKVLLRTLIENMFILVAITLSAENATLYYNLSHLTKLKGLRHQKIFNRETFHQKVTDKFMQDLEEKVKSLGLKEVKVEEWATKARLTDFYHTAYINLSWTVHSNILDSARLLKGFSDEDIRAVEWHPELDEVGLILNSAIECNAIGTKHVNQLFKLGQEKEIEAFQVQNRNIVIKSKLKS